MKRDALKDKFKLLLTATPLQNSLMELYGLVSVIDDRLFGDETSFKTTYGGRPDQESLLVLRDRLKPICRRTLRKDAQEAGPHQLYQATSVLVQIRSSRQ